MIFQVVCFFQVFPPKHFVSFSDEENTVTDLRLMQRFLMLPNINIAALILSPFLICFERIVFLIKIE